MKTLLINGPTNAIRIEGTVNGDKKILYLFSDFHMEIKNQTQCDSIYSVEFKDYLLQNFNDKKMFDLFFEIQPNYIDKNINNIRKKYIHNMFDFFKKLFNYDEKTNKVNTSEKLKNVRFHYMDIRNKINIDRLHYLMTEITQNRDYFSINECNKLYDISENMLYDIEKIKKIIFQEKQTKNKKNKVISPDYNEDVNNDILFKMFNFDNKTIGNEMKKIRDTYLENFMNKLKEKLEKLKKQLDEYIVFLKSNISYKSYKLYVQENQIVYDIKTIIHDSDDLYSVIGVMLTDIYFLRRFLDKTYIKNAIIYGGYLHTLDYIYLLVKHFNFKITHCSYVNKNIDYVTEKIKKSYNDFTDDDYHYEFLNKNIEIYQCSNVTDFPKFFL